MKAKNIDNKQIEEYFPNGTRSISEMEGQNPSSTWEKYQKRILRKIGKYPDSADIEIGDYWPKAHAKMIKSGFDAKGSLQDAFIDSAESVELITNKIWGASSLYPQDSIIKPMNMNRFVKESGRAVASGIKNGLHIVISRVLETNLGWILKELPQLIEDGINNGHNPQIDIFLSHPKTLRFIGEKEAEKAKEREKNLCTHPDFSYNGELIALRHLRLQAATLIALYFIRQKYPSLVSVFLQKQNPTIRCNIVKDRQGNNFHAAYYVQMREWEIGLDSRAYKSLRLTHHQNLYREVVDATPSPIPLTTSADFDRIIQQASDIENDIISSNYYGKTSWSDIETSIYPKLSLLTCLDNKLRSPNFINDVQSLMQGRTEDIKAILESLEKEQKALRKITERIRGYLKIRNRPEGVKCN